MKVTDAQIAAILGRETNGNARSVLLAVNEYGARSGLDRLHRLAHFFAQIMHESGMFNYDKEVWGPTTAQSRYDTRTDLGNTPERDGDGYKFRGRTGIQITGQANTKEFRDWCRRQRLNAPDFVADPDAMLTDPWEGLGPIWYWASRDLNGYADQNNIEMVTRRINGGMNGYADRLRLYTRCALVLSGYGPDDVSGFQMANGLTVDGVPGPQTRDALHRRLLAAETAPTQPAPSGLFAALVQVITAILKAIFGGRK